jgi:hypothetical protein
MAEEGSPMPSSVKEMLAEANAAVARVPPSEARALIGRGDAGLETEPA